MFKNSIISIIIFILSIVVFFNIKQVNNDIYNTWCLWTNKIIPSIPVSYFLGNLLYYYNNIFKYLFPIFKRIFNFESQESFLLYVISFIIGNPTSTILITNAYEKGTISKNETIRLLRSSSFISIFFLLFVFSLKYSIPILIGQLLSSIIINKSTKVKTKVSEENKGQINLFYIIEKLPVVLLNILATMILSSLCKAVIYIIFPTSNYLIPTLLAYLEITSGIEIISNLYNGIFYLFFCSTLVSFHGFAILLQVFIYLKQKKLNIRDYLKYRLVHSFLSTIFSILLYLIMQFIF